MNAMVGDAGDLTATGVNSNNPHYKQFFALSQIPAPSSIFVFLDEHADSINDGYFLNRLDDLEWTDLPASYHNGAANFTFADGHMETHRWVDPATKPPARPDAARLPRPVALGDRADCDWVRDRTSVEVSSALSKTSL